MPSPSGLEAHLLGRLPHHLPPERHGQRGRHRASLHRQLREGRPENQPRPAGGCCASALPLLSPALLGAVWRWQEFWEVWYLSSQYKQDYLKIAQCGGSINGNPSQLPLPQHSFPVYATPLKKNINMGSQDAAVPKVRLACSVLSAVNALQHLLQMLLSSCRHWRKRILFSYLGLAWISGKSFSPRRWLDTEGMGTAPSQNSRSVWTLPGTGGDC